jgi:hypothetical protein
MCTACQITNVFVPVWLCLRCKVYVRNVSRICNNSSKKIKEDLARRVG